MARYTTVTTLGDFGPWVSKLVLDLPVEVGENDVSPELFNVHCTRRETATGAVVKCFAKGEKRSRPSQGYVPALAAYPCDETGARLPRGTHAALEMGELPVNKRVEDRGFHSRFVENDYRVTQLAPLPGARNPVTGLVFDECAGNLCPELEGWHEGMQEQAVDGYRLAYTYYEPSFSPYQPHPYLEPVDPPERAALIVWLHGAGEGGSEVWLTCQGERVASFSQPRIQGYFGGAAWVLAPQSPTFWMDDGENQLGRVNESIYEGALKALIDEFVAAHADRIDPDRIIVGGLSNGGFMTVRLCADYPGCWAAGVAVCAPFFEENQTPELVDAVAKTPLWFVHSKGDPLVDPRETSLPLYARLREAGAEAHFTYFHYMEDLTGVYHEPDGRPLRISNHRAWIHVHNDLCRTDLDGSAVFVDGEPVGLWEWAASKRRG